MMGAWIGMLLVLIYALGLAVCGTLYRINYNKLYRQTEEAWKQCHKARREIRIYREVCGLQLQCFEDPVQCCLLVHVTVLSNGNTVVLKDDNWDPPDPGLVAQLQLLR